jgi:hypothetical protein
VVIGGITTRLRISMPPMRFGVNRILMFAAE